VSYNGRKAFDNFNKINNKIYWFSSSAESIEENGNYVFMEQQPWVPQFGNRVQVNSRAYAEPKENEIEKEGEKKSLAKIFDGIIIFSIVAIFLGLPLFFTGLTFQGIDFEKQIYFYFWILLGLIAWWSKGAYLGEIKIRRTALDIPIIAFWLFFLANSIFSIDRWHSLFGFFGDPSRGFLNITAVVISYFFISSNFSEKTLKWIFRSIIISGSIVVVYSALALLGIKFAPGQFSVYLPLSLIGSTKGLSIFASAMLPIFIIKVLKIQSEDFLSAAKKKIYSAILLVMTALDLFLILALSAYIPWLGLLVGIVVLLIFILSKIVRPKEAWNILPMAVFVIVLAFLMMGSVNIARVNLPPNVSIPYKTAFSIDKEAMKNSFFLGVGPANYSYVFSKYLPKGFDNMNVRFFQGEGLFLEAIPTIGAVGTILFVILILTFIGTAIFLLTREKEKNKLYSLGVVSSAMILLFDVLTTRTEAMIFIWAILMCIIAVAVLSYESNIRENYFNFSLKASPKYALTLAFISLLLIASVAFLFVFIGKIYVSDLQMGSAIRTETAQNKVSEDGSIAKILKAIRLNNREGRYLTRLGQEYMVLVNQEMAKSESDRDVNKIQLYLNTAIRATKQGEDLYNGKDVSSTESLAQIYENSGIYVTDALKFAQDEYQKASDLEPSNPAYYVSLGQIKIKMAGNSGSTDEKKKLVGEAKDLFQKSVDTRKNYANGYYNLSLAQEALGQLDDAINSMASAASVQSNNINYLFNLGRLYAQRGSGDDNKNAEALYNQVLSVNSKDINTIFSLGLLYEKEGKKNEAIDQYTKLLGLLPDGSEQTKSQIQKMVSNVKNGIANTPESLGLTEQNQAAEAQTAVPNSEINQ
jgi:tetratricopeptide (TPR) repeat protein